MGINILSISTLMLFLMLGLVVVDADLAMEKKAEVKALIELANHHASFAVDEALKTEGIIDLVETAARERFDQRLTEDGHYVKQLNSYQPSTNSVTTDPLAIADYYIDFTHWQLDTRIELVYEKEALKVNKVEFGSETHPAGGDLEIAIALEDQSTVQLPPKQMIGPSYVTIAYMNERPLVPFLPSHAFPVASVEELKW